MKMFLFMSTLPRIGSQRICLKSKCYRYFCSVQMKLLVQVLIQILD